MLLVYKCLFFWLILYCHILELVIDVVTRRRIVVRIQLLEFLDVVFVYLFITVLFCLIFLFCKLKASGSLLLVLFLPIILLCLTILFSFTFSVLTSFLKISILREPNYRTRLHLVGYRCLPWYFLLLLHTLRRFCLAIWSHGLVRYVLCVDLTCGMYHQYGYAHNLGTFTYFLYLPVFLWR